jgi:thioredoxin-dependent peroxiredoxin
MSTWLEEGQKAPHFSLPADDGGSVSLADLKGKPAVVYFYPRDDTPGCTREACAFRDRKTELKKLGVTVVGVSTDDVKSHGKFRDKYSLNFPLLADMDHSLAEAFGAWQEKNMYGKKSMGVVRSTFLLDAAGTVCKVWRKVNVDGHDEAVIEAVKGLSSNAKPQTASAAKRPTKAPAKQAVAKKKTAKRKPAAKKK